MSGPSILRRITVTCAVLVAALVLQAQLPPDPSMSYATSAAGCLRIAPERTGPTLAERGLAITVTVLDANGDPVSGVPAEDIYVWMDPANPDFRLCAPDWRADAPTNVDGQATISGAGIGGGQAFSGLRVAIDGVLIGGDPLPITVVSTDIDASASVSIIDLAEVPGGFAVRYLSGVYDPYIDFNCDASVDLLDVTTFVSEFSDFCP